MNRYHGGFEKTGSSFPVNRREHVHGMQCVICRVT